MKAIIRGRNHLSCTWRGSGVLVPASCRSGALLSWEFVSPSDLCTTYTY